MLGMIWNYYFFSKEAFLQSKIVQTLVGTVGGVWGVHTPSRTKNHPTHPPAKGRHTHPDTPKAKKNLGKSTPGWELFSHFYLVKSPHCVKAGATIFWSPKAAEKFS